jgi:hypothetical protein
MMPKDDDVREFWLWFESVASAFAENYLQSDLAVELDRRVCGLGCFAWELGPGLTEPNALVISPGGDPQRLQQTRAIVARAPDILNWEFHPAIPPKQWKMVFTMEDSMGGEQEVDANDWRYVLLRYPDGVHEIHIEAHNTAHLSESCRDEAALIALDGMLGEERRIEAVQLVSSVLKFDEKFEPKAQAFREVLRAFVVRH